MLLLYSAVEVLLSSFVFVNFSNVHVYFLFCSVMFRFLHLPVLLRLFKYILICECIWLFLSLSVVCYTLYFRCFMYFSILVMFFKCILIWECTCLFLSSLWKCYSVFLYLLDRREILFIGSFLRECVSRWCTLKHCIV